jgi:hypothetical protein
MGVHIHILGTVTQIPVSSLLNANHPGDNAKLRLAETLDDHDLFRTPKPPLSLAVVDDSSRHHFADARKSDQLFSRRDV